MALNQQLSEILVVLLLVVSHVWFTTPMTLFVLSMLIYS
jgi:hypothetical protein